MMAPGQGEIDLNRLWLTLLLLFAMGAAVQAAPTVPAADAREVRAVVQAQLDAFAADDAARAFSYAGPAIRTMFGTPDRFLAMVRASYPVVYRPASVAFLIPEVAGDEVIQGVHFGDASGRVWLAIYRLQRLERVGWRINGCQLVESGAKTT